MRKAQQSVATLAIEPSLASRLLQEISCIEVTPYGNLLLFQKLAGQAFRLSLTEKLILRIQSLTTNRSAPGAL